MKESTSGQLLTSHEDIYRALRALQLSRSLITLRFGHDAHAYSSLLIHCDLEQRRFVLDEVRPDAGNARLKQGEHFTLIAFYDGIQVLIKDCIVLTSSVPNFPHAYALAFPKSLYHKQRRQVYRANVARTSKASIALASDDREGVLQGRVADISPLGIGCEFSGFVHPDLKTGEVFERCRLNINSELAFESSLIVRHPAYRKDTDTTLCGFEFKDLDTASQKSLDRFILYLQRQARRVNTHRPA